MSGGGTGDNKPNPAWIDQRAEQYFLRANNILRKLWQAKIIGGDTIKIAHVIELAKIIQVEEKYGR